ncbi:MAG: acyl transferase, partial [Verrucomicrobia bacterium]|nr:acyl transferase [Cytophagales bacterium]
MIENFIDNHKRIIFSLQKADFEARALAVFRFQAIHNPVYKSYLQQLEVAIEKVQKLTQIPFLPIEFFKTHQVLTGNPVIEEIFESSGTTGQVRSRHLVADTNFYKRVCQHIFEDIYGKISEFSILALLPSYLERDNSSL